MLEKPLILFDGKCNLCNRTVNFILRNDNREIFLFSPYQSESGKKILTKLGFRNTELKTVYLIENDEIYSRSTAVLLILKRLPFPWKLLFAFVIVPRSIRDSIYDVIAKSRYRWFGEMNSCRIPSEREKHRFLS